MQDITRQEMQDITRHNARRLAEVARKDAPHMALQPKLDALSHTAQVLAQVLASRAKPHVEALAHTAQELTVKAKPHMDAFAEAVTDSAHSFAERAQPQLEAFVDSTAEASAEASAQVASLRQWCLEQLACDIEREHIPRGTEEEDAGGEDAGSEDAEFPVDPHRSRGVSSPLRSAQDSAWPSEQLLLPPPPEDTFCEEETASAPSVFLPPPGLHFETARLLASQRQFFFNQRNPTLLTHQGTVPPFGSLKPFAA
jgi:hypothetical protein